MIGPAYAGKTTLLYHFKLGEHVQAVVGMEKQGWWGPKLAISRKPDTQDHAGLMGTKRWLRYFQHLITS